MKSGLETSRVERRARLWNRVEFASNSTRDLEQSLCSKCSSLARVNEIATRLDSTRLESLETIECAATPSKYNQSQAPVVTRRNDNFI